ncbi:MAG: Crp/Fnr family transcriptional regulator [Bacteroidetes bacterium]|nr:Crp/Fnr family transcriptional regulator [Bacteroidota bacterium]
MNASIWKKLQAYSTEKLLHKDEYFVREGQYVKSIAFVNDGMLRSYQIDYKGNDITTNFFPAGKFCSSYYSLYKEAPSFENVVALTKTKLLLIPYAPLMEAFEHDLEVITFNRKSVEEVCIQKDIRIAKMLQLDAKNRYLWFQESHPEVMKIAPLKHIASYLGINPETLSRVRREIIS